MKPAICALFVIACSNPSELPNLDVPPGGRSTVADSGRDAFGHPVPTLSREDERRFFRGRALFRDVWVSAPASAATRDGLGPLFNARACEPCHQRDGRGAPPVAGAPLRTMLLRLSVPTDNGPVPHPIYGGQWQPLSTDGVPAEGEARVSYRFEAGEFAAGDPFELAIPTYTVDSTAYGPLGAGALLSPRVAPAMHGLGLLENIAEADILALADEHDRDGDGISGRPNRVFDVEQKQTVLGRFGWKSNQPSLRQQTAGAFLGDIGMTSSLFPNNDCSPMQAACGTAAPGGEPELIEEILADVTFYSQSLAVPARRNSRDPDVVRGQALFFDAGCQGCHTPQFSLGADLIQPFTDLLLHDMGDGLADGRPDFLATGTEWRTPPLWGLGLIPTVNGHARLLHDGRARDISEAILWHGSEASAAASAYRLMAPADRQALVAFVRSL